MPVDDALVALIREVLDHQGPPAVEVLRVPPGMGKTTITVQEVLRRVAAGEWQRVLWAVKDTTHADGLAAQAQGQFTREAAALGLPEQPRTRVVLGRTALAARERLEGDALEAAYRAQFGWDVPVLIVSHAHLPLVLSASPPRALAGLRRAQRLIVDEDPCRALVLTETSLREDGLRVPDGHAVLSALEQAELTTEQALAPLLRRLDDPAALAADGLVKAHRNPARGNRETGYELAGREFLRLLRGVLGERDDDEGAWRSFVVRLARLLDPHATRDRRASPVALKYARLLTLGLRRDLDRRADQGYGNRFGLVWAVQRGQVMPPNLRYALPRTLDLPCSVVVLDAYAHLPVYRRAFAPAPVHEHALPAPRPLEVLVAPTLRRDRADLHYGRGQTQLDVIARELALFAAHARRGTLFILPKSEREGLYGAALRQALTARGVPPDRWAMIHWRAGRGFNRYAGWDVVALTPPKLPREHRDQALAAWTDSPHERRAWHHREEIAELLQMLHRSRQTRADPAEVPRVMMAFLPCALCPVEVEERCTPANGPVGETCSSYTGWDVRFLPYAGHLRIRPGAWYPQREQLFHEAARVVLEGAGGVPLLAFEAIGLSETNSRGSRRHQDLFRAGRAIRTWAGNVTGEAWQAWARGVSWEIREGETLEAWRTRVGTERAALRVTAERDNNRERLREVLTEMGLGEWRVKAGAQNAYTVYARDEESARAALTRLLTASFACEPG